MQCVTSARGVGGGGGDKEKEGLRSVRDHKWLFSFFHYSPSVLEYSFGVYLAGEGTHTRAWHLPGLGGEKVNLDV